MGRQGIVAGDVGTYFNDEEFLGTAHDREEAIGNRYEGEVLTFVFNANEAVAGALRSRSMILELAVSANPSGSRVRRSLRRPGLASRLVTV